MNRCLASYRPERRPTPGVTVVYRFLLVGFAIAGLTACAERDRLAVTTVSAAKCFYDSNVNQQRCRHDVAMQGRAADEPRSGRHDIDLKRQPLAALDVLADGGQQSQREPGYTFGYDARFEAGYRTPERFDTTVYEGTSLAPSVVAVVPPPRPARRLRQARRPVFKD